MNGRLIPCAAGNASGEEASRAASQELRAAGWRYLKDARKKRAEAASAEAVAREAGERHRLRRLRALHCLAAGYTPHGRSPLYDLAAIAVDAAVGILFPQHRAAPLGSCITLWTMSYEG